MTDADGRAAIQGSPGEMIQTLQVTTPDFGTQLFTHEKGFRTENELRLRPVVALEGQVTADDLAATGRVALHLRATAMLEGEERAWVTSSTDVTSDDRGRFSVPRFISGDVYARRSSRQARSIARFSPAATTSRRPGNS